MVQQGRVVQGHLAGEKAQGLPESRRLEIQQYERIVKFQEAVLTGNHPTVKLPPHLIASTPSSKHALDAPAKSDPTARKLDNSQSFSANARQPPVALGNGQPVSGKPSATTQFSTGNTEINPILLEKSEGLIRAEINLKRQRLERALREDVEQHRVAAKNVAQGEPPADFDLNNILAKALTLVQASAAPSPAGENVGATNHETSSDSFDDNTFYSSRHDTPESVLISRVRNESEDVRMPDFSDSQQTSSVRNQPPQPTHSGEAVPTPSGQAAGLSSHLDARVISSGSSQNPSIAKSQSGEAGNKEPDRQERTHRTNPAQQPSDPYLDKHPPSPLIQTYGPSYTLQSAQASPLTAARRPVVVIDQGSSSSTGTPQQVAALRTEPAAGTSPESSPQGGKQSEKKKGRRKKRKADRQAPEAEVAYVKPEPQSPSPMNAPSYIRPNKRQRHLQQQANEPSYEDARYEPQASSAAHEIYPPHLPTDDRIPLGYERTGVYPQRAASAAVAGPVYGREYTGERYVSGAPYLVGQPASHHDTHPRSTNSQVIPAEGYPRPSWSYQGSYETPSTSTRREGEAFIAPPRPPPTRIIVDAFGREYIEPPRSSVRHSVAPPTRSDEPEIIYERAAPRAVSRHAGVDSYEQAGAVYRRSSPSYMPRRVVTQPDFVSQDYRDNRLREYPPRPMASASDFVEVMVPQERRRVEGGPREYISRAASVRPAEPLRYEVSRDYGQVQSVRPEAPVRQYATSVHPDGGRESQPYIREYGSRPVETVMRRDYSARPAVERYYEQPVRGEEIAFIERPRGNTQEIVYADDARREVYR
ncbi:hypothetical protein B0T10DRAFT_216488 [Thelonectria olida]|uniref:Uncharacterized protein n=1 Tax=Thelonectria olida TaxID=1576542 RepID=A0A9P8WFD6_9HYPO|nr:hypothetical protein B0T10DRAFT_216488 [Thelonectria olida]